MPLAGGVPRFPVLVCEVAFTTNPGDVPVWENVSSYLRAFTIRRGRQYELDRFEAGTATFTLDNRDRRFDPSYTSSPYYPDVLPMRRIRLTALWEAEYTLFDGYVDGWPQSYAVPNEARVDVSATDAFKVLSLAKLPSSVYEYEVLNDAPSHWWRLNEPQGVTVFDSVTALPVNGLIVSANGLGNTVVSYGATGSSPFDSDTAVEITDPGDSISRGPYIRIPQVVTNPPWTVEFWCRDLPAFGDLLSMVLASNEAYGDVLAFALTGVTQPTSVTLLYTGSDSRQHIITASIASVLRTPGWHHFAATHDGSTITLYVDGVNRGSAAFSLSLYPADVTELPAVVNQSWPSGVVTAFDEVAFYGSALSSARILAHYNGAVQAWAGETSDVRVNRALDAAGFTSSSRALDVGIATLGSAVLNNEDTKTHINNVEIAEGGNFFFAADGTATFYNRHRLINAGRSAVATFGDNVGELPYADIVVGMDDTHIINEAKVTRASGATRIYSDATSQATYLVRSFEQTNVQTQTDDDSLYAAEYLVNRFKDAQLRVEQLTVKPQHPDNTATLWPAVLGLDLLDVITVNRRPQAIGSAISQSLAVEGITHTASAESSWVTTYQLGQLPPPAWTIEDPTYGAVDSIGKVAW